MVRFTGLYVCVFAALIASSCGQRNENFSASGNQQTIGSDEELSQDFGFLVPQSMPAGYNYEGVGFTASKSKAGPAVHRLRNPRNGDYLFTVNRKEVRSAMSIGYKYEGIAFYSALLEDEGEGEVVLRLYNPANGYHFYTVSAEEASAAVDIGWTLEGDAFQVYCADDCEDDDPSRINVHRFFNGRNHFYSTTGR